MTILAGIVGLGVLVALASREPWELLLVPLAVAVFAAVHEGGHVVGALIGRFGVSAVVIGHGPRWARVRFGGVQFELRAFPTGGGVLAVAKRTSRHMRRRVAIFVASGVVACVVVGGVVAALASREIRIAVLAAVALELVNLVPFKLQSAWGPAESDGAVLLRAQRDGDELRMRYFAVPRLVEIAGTARTDPDAGRAKAEQLDRDPAADDDVRWLADFVIRAGANGFILEPRDRILLVEMRERRHSLSFTHLTTDCLFNAAYTTLLAGGQVDDATVDELRRLYAKNRSRPAFAGTLAWTLVAAGAPDEGLRVAEEGLATREPVERTARAARTAVLGLALARCGKVAAARRARTRAVALDPDCPVLPYVDDAITQPVPAVRPVPAAAPAAAPADPESDPLEWVEGPSPGRRSTKVMLLVATFVLGISAIAFAFGAANDPGSSSASTADPQCRSDRAALVAAEHRAHDVYGSYLSVAGLRAHHLVEDVPGVFARGDYGSYRVVLQDGGRRYRLVSSYCD